MINFTELYDQSIDNLFAFGSRMTNDREMLKDCIQDVFVKLYTKRGELENVSNIESYLYVSLRNRLNDEFRSNSRISDNDVSSAEGMESLTDNDETVRLEKIEDTNRINMTVDRFMQCLSPRQRQIINLYYIEQLKYDDICRIMGINYQSVRNLMHRSISRLRYMASLSQVG